MQSLRATMARSGCGVVRFSVAAMTVATAVGCSGAKPAEAPAASPAPATAAATGRRGILDPVVALHWNDALDTTRVLEARTDQRLRVVVTITGVDTLQGYSLRFRLEPMDGPGGTAWRFADHGGCGAARWLFSAEPDPQAPAPWANKLLITDLKPGPDGTVWMLVAGAWDKAILDPDSTYLLCHLDFDPPVAAGEGRACPGWDGAARIYCESGEIALRSEEFSLQRLGSAVTVRPVAPPKP